MTSIEYKDLRMRAGFSNSENWELAIMVTPDQNKAYASGRTAVPPEVEQRAQKLVQHIANGAKELHQVLAACLPNTMPHFAEDTLTITIERASGKPFVLRNRGLDTLNGWCVYTTDENHPPTFLRVPEKPWGKIPSPFHWTLWRGPFQENRTFGRFQSYPNKIDADLLQEVLASAK